jgi:hypothetical protein
VHTLFGPFLPSAPPTPAPSLSPQPPSLPGRNCSALFSNFVEEGLMFCLLHSWENMPGLLVEMGGGGSH